MLASKVRGLASRSAEAAKVIKCLISVSVEKVEARAFLVDEVVYQRDQVRPRHHEFYRAHKLLPSRSLRRLAQPQALLLHGRHRLIGLQLDQAHG